MAYRNNPKKIADPAAYLVKAIERNNATYSLLQRRDTELVNAATAQKLGRRGLMVNKVDPSTFRARLHSYYERWGAFFGALPWGMLQSSIGGGLG